MFDIQKVQVFIVQNIYSWIIIVDYQAVFILATHIQVGYDVIATIILFPYTLHYLLHIVEHSE